MSNIENISREIKKIKRNMRTTHINQIIDKMTPEDFILYLKNLNPSDEIDTEIKRKLFLDDNHLSIIIERLKPNHICQIHEALSQSPIDAEIKRKLFLEKKIYKLLEYEKDLSSSFVNLKNFKWNIVNQTGITGFINLLNKDDKVDIEIKKEILLKEENLELYLKNSNPSNLGHLLLKIVNSKEETDLEIKRKIFLNKNYYQFILDKLISLEKHSIRLAINIIRDILNNQLGIYEPEIKRSILLDTENFNLLTKLIVLDLHFWKQNNHLSFRDIILDLDESNENDIEIIKKLFKEETYLKNIIECSTDKQLINMITSSKLKKINIDDNTSISKYLLQNNEVITKITNINNAARTVEDARYYNHFDITDKIDYQLLYMILDSHNLIESLLKSEVEVQRDFFRLLKKLLKEAIDKSNIINDEENLSNKLYETMKEIYSHKEEKLQKKELDSPVGNFQLYIFNCGTYVIDKNGNCVRVNLDKHQMQLIKDAKKEIINIKKLSHHEDGVLNSLILLENEEDIPKEETIHFYGIYGAKKDCLSIVIEGESVCVYYPSKMTPNQSKIYQEIINKMRQLEQCQSDTFFGLKFIFSIAFSNEMTLETIGCRPIFIEDLHRIMVNQSIIEEQDIKFFESNSEKHKK